MRVRLFSSLGLVVLALAACAEASSDDLENGQNVTPGVGGGGSGGSSSGGKGGSSGTSSGGAGTGGAGTGGAGTGGAGAGGAGAGGAGASGSSGQAGGGQAGAAAGAGGAGAGGAGAGGAGTGGASGAGAGGAGTGGAGTGGASGAGAGGAGTGGAGGGGAGAGAGGAGAGGAGAGGDAGAAGSAGTGGAGAGGDAGAGGAGAGGASGNGGAGAAGSAGTGGGVTGPSLVVVGTQPGADAFAGVYSDGGAWSGGSVALKITGRPGLGVDGPGARLVARNGASSNQLHQAVWSPAGFAAATPLPGAPGGVDGPFVASSSSAMWATLLGNDNKHYVTKASAAGAFGLVSPLGADVPQAFGDSAASIATAGADTWAIYSGQNDGLYALHHDGNAWSGSEAVPGAGSRKAITPQIAMAGSTPTVVFVRGGGTADNAVCVTQRGASSWSAPVAIPTALSSRTPGVAALANGDLVVAWHGYNDDGVYAARRSSGTWSSVIVLETNAGGAAGAPVVVTGLPGADAEIVYGKGGKVRHARLTGTTASPVDAGGTSVIDVAAVVVP